MKILIDTHYLLWLFFDKKQIKEDKQLLLLNPNKVSFYQLPIEHKDPFDRLLIWQSIQQKMVFLSNDSNNKFYEKYGLNHLS